MCRANSFDHREVRFPEDGSLEVIEELLNCLELETKGFGATPYRLLIELLKLFREKKATAKSITQVYFPEAEAHEHVVENGVLNPKQWAILKKVAEGVQFKNLRVRKEQKIELGKGVQEKVYMRTAKVWIQTRDVIPGGTGLSKAEFDQVADETVFESFKAKGGGCLRKIRFDIEGLSVDFTYEVNGEAIPVLVTFDYEHTFKKGLTPEQHAVEIVQSKLKLDEIVKQYFPRMYCELNTESRLKEKVKNRALVNTSLTAKNLKYIATCFPTYGFEYPTDAQFEKMQTALKKLRKKGVDIFAPEAELVEA